jgi:RNA-directed DNA polymerase
LSTSLEDSNTQLILSFYSLETRRDIAALLDLKYSRLDWHIRRSPEDRRYVQFTIPKKSGEVRQITAPVSPLKIIQFKLNQVLQAVYERERKAPVYGFVKGQSILDNALVHTRKRFVLNIDLKDFFPHITFKRVKGIFKNPPYNLNDEVATCLAQICCHEGKLPQGAPTSPIISNMVCAKLDSKLRKLANEHKCHYSRYADDITFSTNMRVFPGELAKLTIGGWKLGTLLGDTITGSGFVINPKKIRMQTKYYRQEVTGLIVNNSKPNVNRRYIREVRAMLHSWERYTYSAAMKQYLLEFSGTTNPNLSPNPTRFLNVISGKINFLAFVRGKDDPLYIKFRSRFEFLCTRDVHQWT